MLYVVALICIVIIFRISVSWERIWLKNTRVQLPAYDELCYAPFGAKFLPEKLHYGAEVVRGNITYHVCGMTVATIGAERWLLYHLKTSAVNRGAVLGVNASRHRLHLRWWWHGGDYPVKFLNELLTPETAVTKLDGMSYMRVADGCAPFVTLGSKKYPIEESMDYSLFRSSTGSGWLLSLRWKVRDRYRNKVTYRDLLIGEDIEAEDVIIHPDEGVGLLKPPRSMEIDDVVRGIKRRNSILSVAMLVVCFAIVIVLSL